MITTVAGSATGGFGGDAGPATAAQLLYPYGVTLDSAGNMFIADTNNHRVRKVTQGTGTITTVAGNGTAGYNGDGPATGARLYFPTGVAVDSLGNLYIADQSNNLVRKVTPATGIISTVAGTGVGGFLGEGGPATEARLNTPTGVAVDAAGNLLIVDQYNHRVRKLTVATGIISTVAGSGIGDFQGDTGLATAAALQFPTGVAVDSAGAMYIADYYNHRVRKVAAPTVRPLLMTTLAGTGTAGYNGDGAAIDARVYFPTGVAVDYAGNVYIADQSNDRVRKINTATGVISTFAGTGIGGYLGEGGPATAARVNNPTGVAVDGAGNVYIADQYNHRVRKVTVSTGVITTIAGTGAAGYLGDGVAAPTAALNYPTAIAVDSAGNVYIADQNNHRIRKVTAATGLISTIAGNGTAGVAGDGAAATAAQLNYPNGVAVDPAGNVYIADTNNHRIRKVTAGTGVITTYAGTGTAGYIGEAGPATATRLVLPDRRRSGRRRKRVRGRSLQPTHPEDIGRHRPDPHHRGQCQRLIWWRRWRGQRGTAELPLRRGGGRRGECLHCGYQQPPRPESSDPGGGADGLDSREVWRSRAPHVERSVRCDKLQRVSRHRPRWRLIDRQRPRH